jgi:hypothetical protein
MGVRSTKTITRTEAIRAIQSHLYSLTNDELSDILLSMFGEKDLFSNYSVEYDNYDCEIDIDSRHFDFYMRDF